MNIQVPQQRQQEMQHSGYVMNMSNTVRSFIIFWALAFLGAYSVSIADVNTANFPKPNKE